MFSERVPRSLSPNRITRAVSTARSGATPIVDLTITNPTCAGIDYPLDLLAALASPDGLKYTPEPFGLPSARAAVAADYARRGETVDPRRIVLTASTSEAYTLLFKLLCAPRGDDALVPTPSYPLFDHLTMLDGVRAVPYRLEYHGRWTLAADELDRAWTDGVRAVLAVSPNNPTGSIVSDDELQELSDRCARRHAALIVDEVFADYPIDVEKAAHRPAAPPPCLTFRLGGLSKSAGLPQVKLGWMAVEGPEALVEEALERLEVVCDAYLSVSTPVQVAAPSLIASGAAARGQILRRVRQNAGALRAAAARHPAVDVLPAEAGWSAVVRVPSKRSEEDLVVELLEQDRILVHPGFFFDFPHESFVVLSLLPEPVVFADGVRRLLERVDG
jgi:aspartate/methionine/tyrosine aminotransferase